MHKVKEAIGNFLVDILETLVIALAIFAVVYFFAFQPHEVIGNSMDGIDNFHTGQYILTDKLSYKFRGPRRGEVLVFNYPLNPSYDYIKRVIGLPGEEIEIKDGKVYIYNESNPNGFSLSETEYLDESVTTTGRAFLESNQRISIPEDSYFVMGDNRSQSSDSRTWGLVKKDEVVGKSLFRYWPPNETGFIDNPNY